MQRCQYRIIRFVDVDDIVNEIGDCAINTVAIRKSPVALRTLLPASSVFMFSYLVISVQVHVN